MLGQQEGSKALVFLLPAGLKHRWHSDGLLALASDSVHRPLSDPAKVSGAQCYVMPGA